MPIVKHKDGSITVVTVTGKTLTVPRGVIPPSEKYVELVGRKEK